jgi:regulation of enolase protein 1 (concanavalin A-like superfamily)
MSAHNKKEPIMSFTRRDFVQQAVAGAAVAGWMSQSAAAANDDLLSRMTWLNPPAQKRIEGTKLTAVSSAKTDFWRKTFYGYITDNGHFLHLPIEGDFRFEARVNGKYAAQYDQAGLMVRLDEKQWMKCGTELVDGKRNASVVFTRDFSDWSTLPDLSQSAPIWWRVIRAKDSIEAHCSADGKTFMAVRQGYFPPAVKVNVGVMCAAPEGAGFESVFDELKLQKA